MKKLSFVCFLFLLAAAAVHSEDGKIPLLGSGGRGGGVLEQEEELEEPCGEADPRRGNEGGSGKRERGLPAGCVRRPGA